MITSSIVMWPNDPGKAWIILSHYYSTTDPQDAASSLPKGTPLYVFLSPTKMSYPQSRAVERASRVSCANFICCRVSGNICLLLLYIFVSVLLNSAKLLVCHPKKKCSLHQIFSVQVRSDPVPPCGYVKTVQMLIGIPIGKKKMMSVIYIYIDWCLSVVCDWR